MRSPSEILKSAIGAAATTLQSIVHLESQVAKAAGLIVDGLTNGKKVLACGNGGSAADAADFCTELACRFVENRRPYPAMNLSQGGNIQRAIEEARHRKLKTAALLGRDGGSVAGIADVDLIVKGDSTARIQEAHKFILHVLCEMCEARLPRK